MTPRALIAEDEPLLAAGLQADLAAVWPALQVVASVGDGHSAVKAALELRPDVCFFDIRMPGASGLEAAQALAEDWPEGPAAAPFPLLVFVTAYDQYALKAFEAQAVDYLVKPLDRPRLAACVQRLQTRLVERSTAGAASSASPPSVGSAGAASVINARVDPTLQLTLTQLRALLTPTPATADLPARLEVIQAQAGSLVHLVPVSEVVYFEAADKYVRVITAKAEHLIRLSLRELLPQLDPQRFWQVHRGVVVQAPCIATARREETGKVTLTLHGRAEKLTVSRLYAHLFKGM